MECTQLVIRQRVDRELLGVGSDRLRQPVGVGPDEDGIAVLSFRGTESTEDWKTNLNAFKNIENGVPVHSGFFDMTLGCWRIQI